MNNKPSIFLVLIIFLSINCSYSQSDKFISWGKERRNDWKDFNTQVIGFDGKYFYTKNGESGFSPNISIKKVDENFNLIQEKSFDLEGSSTKRAFSNVLLMNNELILFTVEYKPSKKKSFLHMQYLNKETLEPKEDFDVVICEGNAPNKLFKGSFNFAHNKEYIIVRTSFSNSKSAIITNFSRTFEEIVFSKKGEVIWRRKPDTKLDFKGFFLDEKNNSHTFNRKSNNSIVIENHSIDGRLLTKRIASLGEGKILNDFSIDKKKNGNFLCYGHYLSPAGQSNSCGYLEGTFFFEFKKDSDELLVNEINNFPSDFTELLKYELGKTKKKKTKCYTYSNVNYFNYSSTILIGRKDNKHIRQLADGGYLIFSEQVSTYRSSSSNITLNTNSRIIVTKINNLGKIEWYNIVPRLQVDRGSRQRKLIGYDLIVLDNELHFLYNDNKKNLTQSDKQYAYQAGKNGSYIADMSIDLQNGELKKGIFLEENDKASLAPIGKLWIDDDHYLIKIIVGSKEIHGSFNAKEAYK